MPGVFVPVDLSNTEAHAAGAETALRTAKLFVAFGTSPFLILADENGKNSMRTQNAGRIRPEQSLSDEQWRVFAAGVEYLARVV